MTRWRGSGGASVNVQPWRSHLTVRVERFLAANGIEQNGRVPGPVEELHRHVDVARVNHASHAQAVMRQARPVGLERRIAVHTGGKVSPMSRGQVLAREAFEVEHVHRLLGRGDERVRILAKGADGWREARERRRREHGLEDSPAIRAHDSYTQRPPTIVRSTGIVMSDAGSSVSGLRPSTTRSASLPGSSEPFWCSSNEAQAPFSVQTRRASSIVIFCRGPQVFPVMSVRVTMDCKAIIGSKGPGG